MPFANLVGIGINHGDGIFDGLPCFGFDTSAWGLHFGFVPMSKRLNHARFHVSGWMAITSLLASTGCQDVDVGVRRAETHNCFLKGCSSGVTIDMSLGQDFTNIPQAAFEVCRNDSCIAADIGDVPIPIDDGSQFRVVPLDNVSSVSSDDAIVAAYMWKSQDEYFAQVSYETQDADDLIDGDRYRVRVVTASGVVLLDASGTVTYQALTPNGPDCPPTCHSGYLSL
jgi:hypothetical protein